MDTAFLGHFIFEQGVDHAVAGGLGFGFEGVGCYYYALGGISLGVGHVMIDLGLEAGGLGRGDVFLGKRIQGQEMWSGVEIPEMRFFAGDAFHGFVVGVQVRVIVDF